MPSNKPTSEHQLTEDVPSSSMSASSQQMHLFPTTEDPPTSATITKAACKTDFPDMLEESLPWVQWPKLPSAASLPNPFQDTWKLNPVVQSSKAGRKRKRLASIEAAVAHKLANPKEPRSNNPLLSTDKHATLCHTKHHSLEVARPLTATDTAQALQEHNQARSDGALPQQSSLMPLSPVEGTQSQQDLTGHPMSQAARQQARSPNPCSSSLVLAEQTCCAEEQAQEARQQRRASLLVERAKALQCQEDQLLAEGQQSTPRTVEQLQQEAQHHTTQQLTQRPSPKQCCTLAQRAQRHVQVPMHLPDTQAAEAAQRCQGMAVRDCAMPLQNGQIMCPQARPCMAALKDLQAAAACQQVVAAAGTLTQPCAACPYHS